MSYDDEYEILGATEILGDDDFDLLLGEEDDDDDDDEVIVGRRARRRSRGRSRGRGRRAQQAARMPLAVKSSPPTKGRELALGFDSVAVVVAAAAAAIASNPQQIFAPERVTVPATIAPNFLINSITIGTAIQFLNATGIHAENFGSTAQDVRLKMDTAQINSVITLNVTNLSAVNLRFFASLTGPAVM